MSEYWKSTPKYWCKHCKTFVKDTKLEKTNHEATPKHQGNLKRFLRDLHKGHEREEREKQRAKDEVDRLNGVVPGAGSKAAANPWERKSAIPSSNTLRQATPTDRKKQLAQLAELGVAVPEDFRKEMAMVGDWQTTSERPIYDTVKKEEDNEDVKSEALNIGVRKRKFEGQEEEEEAGEVVVRKGWGSTTKTYTGVAADGEDDLDVLLGSAKGPNMISAEGETPRTEFRNGPSATKVLQDPSNPSIPPLKREKSSNSDILSAIPSQNPAELGTEINVKSEEGEPSTGILFKKRRSKPIRQKGRI